MARFGHAASAVALLVALSTSAEGRQVQTDYSYDSLGRLTKVARPGSTTDYSYDSAGNRTRVTTAQGNNPPPSTNYTINVPATGAYVYDPRPRHADPDGDVLTVTKVTASGAPKGSLTKTTTQISYEPNPGQAGQTDTFTYEVDDGKGGIGVGTVTVAIAAASGELIPVAFTASSSYMGYTGLTSPTGMRDGQFQTVDSIHGTNYTANAWIKADLGSTMTVGKIKVAPANGAAPGGWGAPYMQGAVVEYSTDNSSWSTVGTITSSVEGAYTEVNLGNAQARYVRLRQPNFYLGLGDFRLFGSGSSAPPQTQAPVAGSTSASIPGNSTLALLPLNLSGGTASSVAVVPPGPSGQATPDGATLRYTPPQGWSGQTSLQYTASNSVGTSAPATVSISVTPTVDTVHATAIEQQEVAITLKPTTNYTSLSLATPPQKGTYRIDGSTLYYKAYAGTASAGDHFAYQATNGALVGPLGYVEIDNIYNGANHSPVGVADNLNISAGSYAYFPAMANDYDPDGDILVLDRISQDGQNGHAYINSNGYVSYVPNPGFSGYDSFYYRISDGRGGIADVAVNVWVQAAPTNHPPTANPKTTDPVWQNGTTWIYPLSNDTDPDGDPLTIQSIDSFYFAYGRVNGVDLTSAPADIGSVTNGGNYIAYRAPYITGSGSLGSSYIVVVVWYTASDGKGGTSQSYEIINVYGPT